MICVQFNPPVLGSYAAWIDAHYGYSDEYVASVYVTGTAVARGSINPKYVVLSVVYAPPGPQSNVNYGTSAVMGTCNSWESSFSTNTTLTKSFTVKIPVFGSLDGKVSSSWTETSDASSSICVNKSTSSGILVRGPLDPNAGIDHNYDVVRLWVNPQSNFTATSPNGAQWSFSFDQRDPANEVDIVDLYVYQLKNPSTIDPGTAQVLARTWAPNNADGSGPGLTSADYAAILASDPLANGLAINSTRFDLEAGETFQYQPPPPGGQPITETFSESYQSTSTQGHSATDSRSVGYSLSGSAGFLGWLNANFTASQNFTWTNKASVQATQTSGQSGSFSITGPPYGYTGRVDVQVYQDNVYGTFMFAFVN